MGKKHKVDFLFEYEVKQRELDYNCLVAAYLKNKGYTVAFINSWSCLQKKPKPYAARVALISAGYDDATYDFFTGYIASFEKVVNMQWEQLRPNRLYQKHQKESLDYSGVGCEIKHVCWGHKEKEWLKNSFKIQENNLKVTGYIPLDFYRDKLSVLAIPRRELFEKYGLDPDKKTLLFVSSFSFVGLPDNEPHGSDEYYHMCMPIFRETQRILLLWFSKLAQENPDIQLIYRYHPAEKNNPEIEKLVKGRSNVFAIADERLFHWILAADKIYNWYSTSMVEMFCSKKDTYLLRPVALPYEIDIPVFDGAQSIKSYEQFSASALEPRMQKFPVDPQKILQWYDIGRQPAYARIGDWLIEVYQDTSYVSRAPRDNVFLHPLKKRIKGYLKRVLVYTGIIGFCGRCFNESAFTEKLENIQKGVFLEDERKKALLDQSSYIHSKYCANRATDEEIEGIIERYQKLIDKL